jgi:hypothetical protein
VCHARDHRRLSSSHHRRRRPATPLRAPREDLHRRTRRHRTIVAVATLACVRHVRDHVALVVTAPHRRHLAPYVAAGRGQGPYRRTVVIASSSSFCDAGLCVPREGRTATSVQVAPAVVALSSSCGRTVRTTRRAEGHPCTSESNEVGPGRRPPEPPRPL